ncbi:S-adenosyl-L-methionine-dependent methyltransferase [Thozetella sp. PMI_491]|nr:S-adenosyl-L-methionine-dependent methyltransferase [Thozetella sp. PMI_491]
MDAALEQLKELASMAGHEARQPLILELTKIIHSMETPDDMIMRIGGLLLADADSPVTVRQLSQKTGAEKTLLGRLLRYLAAIAMVNELSKDTFVANHASRNMTAKTVNPEYYTLPTHLKKTGYKNPNDETYISWHDAFNTDQGPFSWFAEHADNMTYFNDYMSLRRGPELGWLSVYPVREEAAGWCQERPLYVNIGGNVGQQCAEFREKYPDIPGRVILQDLAHSIAAALPTPGVENTVHNFFEAQPVKGAMFYFLRGIFHTHPDSKVRLILEHTKAAMTSESILLIDEIIPPEVGVRLDAAAHDITMLAANAGAERSEAQWRALFAGFGLRLVKTYLYNAPSYESVMDVRLV